MCGRFHLLATAEQVAALYGVAVTQLMPRYNIAPTQPIAAVRHSRTGGRELTYFHWGLIPSWSKDTKFASRMINARSETAHEKPSFRAAYKRRRCLIPVTGFYEWQKVASGKQPMCITAADAQNGSLLSFAGLWEHWQSADGSEIESATILTGAPNELMTPIHNRMPIFIEPDDFDLWLDASAPLPAVQSLLRCYPAEKLRAYPVSTHVNTPRNDDPTCIAPLIP